MNQREAIYKGQPVQVIYDDGGHEVTIQLRDGSRLIAQRTELSPTVPTAAAPRPMITKSNPFDTGTVAPPKPPDNSGSSVQNPNPFSDLGPQEPAH